MTPIYLRPIISKNGWTYKLGYNGAPIGNGSLISNGYVPDEEVT